MAGVKGRSGGKRANTGGARPNSGPKKKPPPVMVLDGAMPPAPVPVVPAPPIPAALVKAETRASAAPVRRATRARKPPDTAVEDQVVAHLTEAIGETPAALKNLAGPVPLPGAEPPVEILTVEPAVKNMDSLEFLLAVMREKNVPIKERIRSAIAAAQYQHIKKGDGGKKDERADKAKTAGAGKFGASVPPPVPLRAVK